jgi:hypothetical protein
VPTRNNKLTSGNGMHVRAKTTADFEQFASGSKLKEMKVAIEKNQNDYQMQ